MIFFYKANGDLINATPQFVFQGSNKANTIYFVCPTSPRNLVNVAFELPNGQSTPQELMTLTEDTGLTGIFDVNGKIFAMWKYEIPSAITTYKGNVKVQFHITSTDSQVLATETAIINVQKGVSNIEPEQTDTYQAVLNLIAEMYSDIKDGVKFEDLVEYQKKVDEDLETNSKEIVKAINESYHLGWKAYGRIFDLNIEDLLNSQKKDTGSIRTKKSQDGHTNEGDGQFGAMFGSRLLMNTDNSLIVGQDNKADNFDGQDRANSCFIAGGNSNTVKGGLASAIGHQLIVNENSATKNNWEPKLAVGLYNKDVKQAVFIVGNGTSETDRKNALEVYYDGHAEVEKQGATDNSVVIKKTFDELKNSLGDLNTALEKILGV